MKENGRYQIQFMKTRSSSGVGSKVDLAFDQESLRISDLPAGALGATATASAAVTATLQRTGSVKAPKTHPVSPGKKMGNLRDMMKKLE